MDLAKLINIRGAHRGSVTKRIKNLEEAVNKEDKTETQLQLQLMERAVAKVTELDELILVKRKDEETVEEIDDQETFMEKATRIKCRAEQLLSSKSSGSADSLAAMSLASEKNCGKLPKLIIKKFSGDILEWRTFYEQYTTSVDNNEALSDVSKFAYLKSLVESTAANAIAGLPLTADNYKHALEILKNRFGKKTAQIQAHVGKLLNMPISKDCEPPQLRKHLDNIEVNVRGLAALQVVGSSYSAILVPLLVSRLPEALRLDWARQDKVEDATVEDLMHFLRKEVESREYSRRNETAFNSQAVKPKLRNAATLVVNSKTDASCPLCKQTHKLSSCPEYSKLSVSERKARVMELKHCLNCLGSNHFIRNCRSSMVCQVCKGKHHTTLHLFVAAGKEESTLPAVSNSVSSLVTRHGYNLEKVQLATSIVNVKCSDGSYKRCRALIDPCSMRSFITRSCIQRLQLTTSKIDGIRIRGIGGVTKGTVDREVECEVFSLKSAKPSIFLHALVTDRITDELQVGLPSNLKLDWINLSAIQLAESEYEGTAKIDILLGGDVYADILCDGMLKSPDKKMVAQKTIFGWIVTGVVARPERIEAEPQCYLVATDSELRRFWEIEEVTAIKPWSLEEKACESHFVETTKREEDGRYMVHLPFKRSDLSLGNSQDKALQRFYQLERKFMHNPALKKQYTQVMEEHFALDQAEIVPRDKDKPHAEVFYLPHHAVIKETSSTTKLRVVFDASAKSTTNISLNDRLMVGPKIQDDLFNILVRFRHHKIAFTADIAKMYNQILLEGSSRDYHRFLWRGTLHEPVQEYRMKAVTFGVASSAFQAQRCLQQLAADEGKNYPLAKEVLMKDFYMDDCLSGASDIESALVVQEQLRGCLRSGGFDLRKWSSNDPKLLQALPAGYRETQLTVDLNLSESLVKTLGVSWKPLDDIFSFQVGSEPLDSMKLGYSETLDGKNSCITKRVVLSEIARLFDPLGLVTPTIIVAKIILQRLWLAGVGWDDPLPKTLLDTWQSWREQLSSIESIEIPRCILPGRIRGCQLHGFCDASEAAYAAVVYLRSTSLNSENHIHIKLVCAKSKVAPVKKVSIPRLELCAAVLLTRLLKSVSASLDINPSEIHAWTDSTVTLDWIYGNHWKTFVANRVSEIQDFLNPEQWRFCPGEENPSDCASRGVSPEVLESHNLWWTGPNWLCENVDAWPQRHRETPSHTVLSEKKTEDLLIVHATTSSEQRDLFLFSSLSKTIRIVSWCIRWLRIFRNEAVTRTLSSAELHESLNRLIKLAQKDCFSKEISLLQSGQDLSTTSKLLALHPFVDDDGIMRVGGRIQRSSLSYNAKHQILLPQNDKLTGLVLNSIHLSTLHGGCQLMLSTLRQNYWIVSGRSVIRSFIHRCTVCRRYKASIQDQLMGELPTSRVIIDRPFSKVGVDYAGPLQLKLTRNKCQKVWICYFVCMVTKASHIELVTDLTTKAFIAALRRFVARRGRPLHIYSDNGTCFIGANRELKELIEFLKSSKNQETLCKISLDQFETQWHFIPQTASHFGGLWEAGIKSIKYHLRRIVGNVLLTYEELSTVLCQIEACLNSRPLSPMSADPNDDQVLTPGHFLITAPLNALPNKSTTDVNINRLKRWELLQRLVQNFWKRWHVEYLTSQQPRRKWQFNRRNVKVDDGSRY